MTDVFEITGFELTPVHKLRDTYEGIQYLKQTDQFKAYMSKRKGITKPFIAWDGEGWTDAAGEHRYMLFMNSHGDHIQAPQLSSRDCLDFMLKTAKERKNAIHIIYGGGYDATHILRDLPMEKVTELRDTNYTEWHCEADADHKYSNYYKITYIPHKWLEVYGRDPVTGKPAHIKLYDIMTFFQMSAIQAWESRNIPVPEVIKTGKATRSDFTWDDIAEVKEYCQLELEMYVQLGDRLREEFNEAGIFVRQFHGPGAVASAVYKQYKVKRHMQEPPSLDIERACQHAYFGGRFEQFKAGHHPDKVYVYDINSAYPHQIQNLPSLADARWVPTKDFDSTVPGVWFCTYDDETSNYLSPHPLPWREKNGSVGFPAHNNGGVWLWHHEAKNASEVHYGYRIEVATDEKPFWFVPEMYAKRQQWKKEGRGGEKALKLALNSLYGKQAQRIGGRDGNRPPWHQLAWAGMVTSGARAQLWEAISQAPESIIAVETDSVASTVPLDLDIGPGLGQWEMVEYDWITYVQSGIYFASDSDTAISKARTRGIDVRELSHSQVLEYMRRLDFKKSEWEQEPLMVASRQFIGLTNRRDWLYGQWQDTAKVVRVAGGKRMHLPSQCAACRKRPKARNTMADRLHDLSANPAWGSVPSYRHTLPWLDDEVVNDPEAASVTSEAVEEYDVPRRIVIERPNG